MTKKFWFEQDENGVQATRLSVPYEKIVVGSWPNDGMNRKLAESFEIYMNVSPTNNYQFGPKPKPETDFRWFPLKETGFWGYEVFYWSKKILDDAFEKNKNVYLHCEAGANRSPCIAMAWLTSKGHNLEKSAKIVAGGAETISDYNLWQFRKNIEDIFIPNNLPEFYKRYEEMGTDIDGILYKIPKLNKKS